MSEQVSPRFADNLEAKWKDVYRRVLDSFEVPKKRLVCWFDDVSHLDPVCPESCRGMFLPIKPKGKGDWPEYVRRDLRQDLFDALIYLPGKTCCANDTILFEIAFAHELQHFVQWACAPDEWNDCSRRLQGLDPLTEAKAWHIPTERDATIISKRVAEALNEPDVVTKYAEAQIKEGQYKPYWEFFQGLSVSTDYDWIKETKRTRQEAHLLLCNSR
jgi:hypothetical protein